MMNSSCWISARGMVLGGLKDGPRQFERALNRIFERTHRLLKFNLTIKLNQPGRNRFEPRVLHFRLVDGPGFELLLGRLRPSGRRFRQRLKQRRTVLSRAEQFEGAINFSQHSALKRLELCRRFLPAGAGLSDWTLILIQHW